MFHGKHQKNNNNQKSKKMVKLVIAGAMYRVGGRIVSPHYSGEYSMVDVDEFCTYQELIDSGFEPEEVEELFTIEVEGETFYLWGSTPEIITEEWELLTDLSEVSVNGIEQLY